MQLCVRTFDPIKCMGTNGWKVDVDCGSDQHFVSQLCEALTVMSNKKLTWVSGSAVDGGIKHLVSMVEEMCICQSGTCYGKRGNANRLVKYNATYLN